MQPAGVILAGGRAQRMGGGDKVLLPLDGIPLLSRIIANLRPHVSALALNANGDPTRFASWDLPIIADPIAGSQGPLAGIWAGLRWAGKPIVSVPGDMPFLPKNLVQTLLAAFEQHAADVVMASWGGHAQPVVALWSPRIVQNIERALTETDRRRVDAFARAQRHVIVDFPESDFAFFNINTPEDLAAASAHISAS